MKEKKKIKEVEVSFENLTSNINQYSNIENAPESNEKFVQIVTRGSTLTDHTNKQDSDTEQLFDISGDWSNVTDGDVYGHYIVHSKIGILSDPPKTEFERVVRMQKAMDNIDRCFERLAKTLPPSSPTI